MLPFNFQEFKAPHKDLFIEASAGTGKTYTIQMMVSRLILEGTSLKKILIVTYTEKAAGELKDRIRKKIDDVLEKKKIDQNDKELNDAKLKLFRKAYQDVDNAAIFTIHSFCQKVLKEYAYDAGRPFDMAMVSDEDVENELDRIIRDEWKQKKEFAALLGASDDTNAFLNSFKGKIKKAVDLYKGTDSKLQDIIKLEIGDFVWKDDSIPAEAALSIKESVQYSDLLQFKTFAASMKTLKESGIKTYKAEFEKTTKGVKQLTTEDFSVDTLVSTIESWNSEDRNPFTPAKIGSTLVDIPDNAAGDALRYIFNCACDLKNIAPKIRDFREAKSQEFQFYIDATRDVFNKWQDYKSKNKLQSFNDMILSVHKTLMSSDSESLTTRLRAQYQYAIIDEFQDTNQLQWDIFRTIFLNDSKQAEKKHHIFVVGDPKQSIYSFQGADVNVYQKAIQAIEKIGEGRLLGNNYRSTDGIIEGCNALFQGDFFAPEKPGTSSITFQKSLPPDNPEQRKEAPTLDGAQTASIWISEEVSPETFAEMAVSQIVNWCSLKNGKTRLQVFDKDYKKEGHPEKLRNVTFKDFAILAKTRSEMAFFEDAMRRVGMPFTRYKEDSLFKSRECAEWIAIFNALNAPDFSYWNRRLLSEALITDFFELNVKGIQKLHYIESDAFDKPDNECRKMIYEWRSLALKFRYAEMLEKIYKDTRVEERLMDVSKLQNLARLRQIGNYAIDYLYKHKCSLDDLIRHLEGLARHNENTDDENGDLVELASDFDAVQVMTIHASKGLEFPVVISAAGFKQYYQKPDEPSIYHQGDDVCIGFGEFAKAKRKAEELEEWKRLFYVDFTRAGSILILPQYDKWTQTDNNGCYKYPEYRFLQKAISGFYNTYKDKCLDNTNIKYCETLPPIRSFNINKLKKDITEILIAQNTAQQNRSTHTVEDAQAQMSSLQQALPGKAILQYSYSSLAGREDSAIAEADNSRTEKEGASVPEGSSQSTADLQTAIDGDVVTNINDTTDEPHLMLPEEESYPRGAKVGDALHNILEKNAFLAFGQAYKNLDEAISHPAAELLNLIDEEFKAQSLPIAKYRESWTAITVRYIWNTLNALLPPIAGSTFTGDEPFRLISLPDTDHKPEVQFGLNADTGDELHRLCKGFIDLLFVRTDSKGNKRYSVLDWKSDTLEDYAPASVKAKVDEEYSVQRVLYSYCLIQWLKQFYKKSEAEIFEEHFGGIYYAFLRGTDGKTQNGIYAQTWKDYATLEAAYKNVKNLMNKSKKKEGEN